MIAVGLDIGTSVSRAAVFRANEPELLQFPDGSHNAPSVVSVSGGTVRVGRSALSRAATHPKLTVRAVKRFLGRNIDDPVMVQLKARSAFGIEARDDGGVALMLGEGRYHPEDIAAALIRHVVDVAEQTCGERPSSAVFTTPYWYGPRQRTALGDAAGRAGITSLQVLSEATCTALSLLDTDRRARMVAIVDVGAGGCTASVLELAAGRVRLVSSAGDPLGGGEDVDWGLLHAVRKGLAARVGEFPNDPGVLEMLRQTCESAKRTLAQASSVTAVIPFLPIGAGIHNQEIQIAREHVDALMRDTVARVGAACQVALESAALNGKKLDVVVAAGGTARLPAVRAAIESVLGPISSRKLDPDGSVALGAAYQAAMLAGITDGIAVIDAQSSTSVRPPAPQGPTQTIPPADIRTVPPPKSSESDRVRLDVGAFRIEMATLLASLRAGAVTDGGRGESAGKNAARASDLLEEDISLPDDVIARNVERSQELWNLLVAVMQAARQYRWDHPQTNRQLQRAVDAIGAFHAEAPRSLCWDIGAMHLSYRGHVIWKPERPPYDRMPYELFAEGIRKVQLKQGLSTAELRDFLGVLARDAALGFGADDDAATALWDRRLHHVGWVAVDAFSDADDPAFQAARDEIAKQLALTGEGATLLGAYVAARRGSGDATKLLALDEATRIAVESQLDPDPAEWMDRFACEVAEAWNQPSGGADPRKMLASLSEWATEQVQARAIGPLFGVFAALADAATLSKAPEIKTEMRAAIQAAILPPGRLREVLACLADGSEVSETTAAGLQRAFESLEPDDATLESMIALYPTLPQLVQDAVVGFMSLHLSGREKQMADTLASLSVEHARVILRALREEGTPQAMSCIGAALHSPHLEVRLEALALLPEVPADRVREDIRGLIEDPAPELRMQVLETISSRRILAAGPVLSRRIQDDSFHELAARERRLLFDAVGALNRGRADALAIDLLRKQTVFRSDAIELSRVIAAEFLSASDSQEALEALERIAKKKWFTSSDLRESAARGAERVIQRRSTIPPRNSGAS